MSEKVGEWKRGGVQKCSCESMFEFNELATKGWIKERPRAFRRGIVLCDDTFESRVQDKANQTCNSNGIICIESPICKCPVIQSCFSHIG